MTLEFIDGGRRLDDFSKPREQPENSETTNRSNEQTNINVSVLFDPIYWKERLQMYCSEIAEG